MTGYSGTPLSKKLGIKEGFKLYAKNPPEGYEQWLAPLPGDVKIVARLANDLDMIHFFTKSSNELRTEIRNQITKIKQNGMIWVSWPKKSSRVKTDITEDIIREVVLPLLPALGTRK